MKKIFTCFVLLTVVFTSVAQTTNPAPTLTREQYLKKSQSQRGTGWLLAIVGGGVLFGTLIATAGAATAGNRGPSFPIIPVAIGAGCMVGSISVFKKAARNKEKGLNASATLNLQKTTSWQPGQSRTSPKPALTFTLDF